MKLFFSSLSKQGIFLLFAEITFQIEMELSLFRSSMLEANNPMVRRSLVVFYSMYVKLNLILENMIIPFSSTAHDDESDDDGNDGRHGRNDGNNDVENGSRKW